jgi:hypothetical protein
VNMIRVQPNFWDRQGASQQLLVCVGFVRCPQHGHIAGTARAGQIASPFCRNADKPLVFLCWAQGGRPPLQHTVVV